MGLINVLLALETLFVNAGFLLFILSLRICVFCERLVPDFQEVSTNSQENLNTTFLLFNTTQCSGMFGHFYRDIFGESSFISSWCFQPAVFNQSGCV